MSGGMPHAGSWIQLFICGCKNSTASVVALLASSKKHLDLD